MSTKPFRNQALFEQDPFLLVARQQPYWLACLLSTPLWGLISTRLRCVKEPLAIGFLIFTAGIAGLATIQPKDDLSSLALAGLAGVGFGALIILIITAVQLSTPHHLIATATAVTVSFRSVAASVFTATYVAAFSDRLQVKLPSYVAAAVLKAGLAPTSVVVFTTALAQNDQAALLRIPGASPAILAAGVAALKQAYADSIRVVYIIAATFGIVALALCWLMADMRPLMDYKVDAPMEDLRTKYRKQGAQDTDPA
jgi:hypothetical protein